MKGVKWKKYLLSSRAIFLGAFVALFWAILGLIPQNASAASLATSSFDLWYSEVPSSGSWLWKNGITYGSPTSQLTYVSRVRAYQWNSATVTPTGNQASIHFETNLVFTSFSDRYLNFNTTNLDNYLTVSCSATVGSPRVVSSSIAYAITPWTNSQGAPSKTITFYGDVALAGITANSAQKFTCQVTPPGYGFFYTYDSAHTAEMYFEQNPMTINYSNDLSETLLQQQISQNSTIISQNQEIINRQQATTDAINSQKQQQHTDSQAEQQKQQATTDAINRTNNFLTDTTAPSVNASGLGNTAGWLPAGPVDSILTLPVQLAQGIVDVFTNPGQCSPIQLPLPWVDYTLELPCVGPLMDQIGFTPIWNIIGGVISAFIIYNTLKWLYKFVDDTLSLRENNSGLWGGVYDWCSN